MRRVQGMAGRAVAALASAWLAAGLCLSLPAGAAAEPSVVVTIKPLHALVAQVMAGVGVPQLLVQGSASPHTYALKPSDARSLNHADIFFRTSEAVEPFTARIVKSLPRSVDVVTLQDAPGLTLLSRRTGSMFERHDHGHAAGHTHRPESIDGHVWLDPDNAGVMVTRIEQALSEKDPPHAATFKANADALRQRLAALSAELDQALEPVAKAPYIVFHDAIQYLERRYRLNVVGSVTINPEVPASAKRLSELRGRIVSLGVVCVFAEPQFDGRLVANLIEGTRARTGTLDPEGGRLEPGPDLYFTLMRKLADDLRGCLSAPA